MRPVLFSIGSFPIPAYGAALMVAFLVAIFGVMRMAPRRGVPEGLAADLGLLSIFGGLVGGRLEYVRTHWAEKFADDPMRILRLNDGGMVFYGGLLLATALCLGWIHLKRAPMGKTVDLVGLFVPIAIGITRLGCFGAGCCYGAPTSLPWAVVYPLASRLAPGGIPLHPTPLYEALYCWAIALAVGLYHRSRFRRADGEGFLLFLVSYAVLRSGNELLRADGERGYLVEGVLTNGQGTSLLVALGAIGLWAWLRHRAGVRSPAA